MVHQVVLDVENVFFWKHLPGEFRPDPGHRAWMRDCLAALAWWTSEHCPPPGLEGQKLELIGYGKLSDPGTRAFVDHLADERSAYITERETFERFTSLEKVLTSPTATPEAKKESKKAWGKLLNSPVLAGVRADGSTLSYVPVGSDPHAGETVLLGDLANVLASDAGPHRIVLCSRDEKVVRVYRDQYSDWFRLAYHPTARQQTTNTKDAPVSNQKIHPHRGKADVVAFNVLKEVHRHRDRLTLSRCSELTIDLLAGIDLLAQPGPAARPQRQPARQGAEAPNPNNPDPVLVSDLGPLLTVDWDAVVAGHDWGTAWGDSDLSAAVGRMLLEERTELAAINGELGGLLFTVVDYQPADAGDHAQARANRLLLLEALAILAIARLHYPAVSRAYGPAIEADKRLRRFRRAYHLIQPAIGRDWEALRVHLAP